MNMTSFDRVAAALEHKEPDQVPLDFGASEVASINIHTMRRLRRHLGMSEDVTLDNIVVQTGKMEDDPIERLNIDVKIVGPNELYNIATDSYEKENVAGQYPYHVAKLNALFAKHAAFDRDSDA